MHAAHAERTARLSVLVSVLFGRIRCYAAETREVRAVQGHGHDPQPSRGRQRRAGSLQPFKQTGRVLRGVPHQERRGCLLVEREKVPADKARVRENAHQHSQSGRIVQTR